MESYTYSPLEQDEIRLLWINRLDSTDNILCAIQHVSRNAMPYTAVSYAWYHGNTEEEEEALERLLLVEIDMADTSENGKTSIWFTPEAKYFMPIRASFKRMLLSLSTAPKNLADPSKASMDEMVFWIDQVCINQADLDEKSAQVRKMHEIYLGASQTYIYLGEPCEDPRRPEWDSTTALAAAHALSFLATIDEAQLPGEMRDDGGGSSSLRIDWEKIPSMPNYRPLFSDHHSIGPLPFQSFARMLDGYKWFDRTWTLQEIACSRKPYLRIGNLELSWAACATACQFSIDIGLTERRHCPLIHQLVSLESIHAQMLLAVEIDRKLASVEVVDDDLFAQLAQDNALRAIPQVFPLVIRKGVTDPRDMVFAMLNLVSDVGTKQMRPLCMSLIDYKLSVRMVYIRLCELWHAPAKEDLNMFTRIVVGSSARALSFLDYATGPRRGFDLPSWVPDWTQMPSGGITYHGGSIRAGIPSSPPVYTHVVFPPAEQFDLNEVPLVVRGLELFTIYTMCQHDPFERRALDGERDPYGRLCSLFSDPYPTTSLDYTEAFALSMEYSECKVEHDRRTMPFWQYISAVGNDYNANAARDQPLAEREVGRHLDMMKSFSAFAGAYGPAHGRAFFVSANGFIGWGPQELQEGDSILLLFGGRSPYIARKLEDGRYNFIGICYILGVMHGEALEEYPENKVNDFVFI